MNLAMLLGLPADLHLVQVKIESACLWIEVCSGLSTGVCPCCGIASGQRHSSSTRTLADTPCAGRAVAIALHVRKFRCGNVSCTQRLFAERFLDYVRPWARKTLRLVTQMTHLGLALGGRGVERIASVLGMRACDQTVLRLLLNTPLPTVPPVTVFGVDDFAFRRGRSYGTILLDLERHRVIDLLPDRSQDALAAWLRQHPQVQVISRDRGGDYAAGARLGAPHAGQIADRFHLLLNAGEAFERCLTRHCAFLRQAAQTCAPEHATARMTKHCPADIQRKQERRAARFATYEQVRRLHQQGVAAVQIARQLAMARGTVLKFIRAASFPEMAARPRPRQIDHYLDYLRERWNAGEHNAQALWREIRAQGYSAGDEQVRRVVNWWRADPHHLGAQLATAAVPARAEVKSYSAHKTRWLLWKPLTDLSEAEVRYVTTLKHLCPQITQAQELLLQFRALLQEHDCSGFDSWLEQCERSTIAEVAGFARGLRRDYAAVKAACCSSWSQGPVEGHVNRLKTLKRQMYGRASFALLRCRVLHQSADRPKTNLPAPNVRKNQDSGRTTVFWLRNATLTILANDVQSGASSLGCKSSMSEQRFSVAGKGRPWPTMNTLKGPLLITAL
jgi:transposase